MHGLCLWLSGLNVCLQVHKFLDMDRLSSLRTKQTSPPMAQQEQEVTPGEEVEDYQPLTAQLSPEAASVNTLCPEATLTELFELLDTDGNRMLDLEELKIVHGSSNTLDTFFKDW